MNDFWECVVCEYHGETATKTFMIIHYSNGEAESISVDLAY